MMLKYMLPGLCLDTHLNFVLRFNAVKSNEGSDKPARSRNHVRVFAFHIYKLWA